MTNPGFSSLEVATRYGSVKVWLGAAGGRPVALVSRHGPGHERLSNQVNHRANLLALNQAGATAVVSCSVCGVLRSDWAIGRPLLATEMYFPSNRLPAGELCTVFDQIGQPGRGHLIAGSLLDGALNAAIAQVWREHGMAPAEGAYGHVDGPRLDTKTEIRALRAVGVDFIPRPVVPRRCWRTNWSCPTRWPPSGSITPTVWSIRRPPEVLKTNLGAGTKAFRTLIGSLAEPAGGFKFANFIYRFGS